MVMPTEDERTKSLKDTSPIPKIHKTAAEALYLSGRILFTNQPKKGTITQ